MVPVIMESVALLPGSEAGEVRKSVALCIVEEFDPQIGPLRNVPSKFVLHYNSRKNM
jgi:hypothetical protein